MKTLNREEIKAVAVEVFKRYPKAQKVSVTTDGEAFITDEGDNAVKNHAKKNRYGKELEIVPFTRDGLEAAAASKPAKVEELVAAIAAAETVEAVEEIKAVEAAFAKPRKTVTDAADARIVELKSAK